MNTEQTEALSRMMQQMANDPNTMRRMMDPANIRAMMQMQEAMQQLQSSGLMPQMPGMGGMGGLGDLAASLGGMGGAMGAPSANPRVPPEELYASQLQQLEAMGFVDQQANIRALSQTGGNVNAAVDRLLSGL